MRTQENPVEPPTEHECQETYEACMATRQARLRQVMGDNPEATTTKIAELAGVDRRTVARERKRLIEVTAPAANGSATGVAPTSEVDESATGVAPMSEVDESATGVAPMSEADESATGVAPMSEVDESATAVAFSNSGSAAIIAFPGKTRELILQERMNAILDIVDSCRPLADDNDDFVSGLATITVATRRVLKSISVRRKAPTP